MEKWNVVLGADVSKKTVDISSASLSLHLKIDNNKAGFTSFRKWCRINGIDLKTTLLVMEHTGGYEYQLMQFCQSINLAYCRVPGLEIKQSLGMVRGKDDKTDSYRISLYGEEKSRRLKPEGPLNPTILKLKQLLSFRKKLVRENAGLQAAVSERRHMYKVDKKDTLVRISMEKIKANKRYVKEVEQELTALVKSDPAMLANYEILISIKGIGPVNALMTIAYTENFIAFTDARKYAAYVGVAPYPHRSGTSVKGRNRVSHLANKELKQELNQAAKSAISSDKEIREYARRKMLAKEYPVVLNNVKFKLILRMFSLVKRGEKYVENYSRVA